MESAGGAPHFADWPGPIAWVEDDFTPAAHAWAAARLAQGRRTWLVDVRETGLTAEVTQYLLEWAEALALSTFESANGLKGETDDQHRIAQRRRGGTARRTVDPPLYADYGFAQIPQTVLHCLGASERKGVPFGARDDLYRQYDTVILLLVDAFGWRFFERYANRAPFLKRFVDHGMVAKLTSQFPSTTAAHVTAIHTGLPVGKSGVFESFCLSRSSTL